MAKKGRLALSRRPLLPSLLQVPKRSGLFLNSLIGSYHVGALLLLEEACLGRLSGGDTRQCKVMYSLTHSLTHLPIIMSGTCT